MSRAPLGNGWNSPAGAGRAHVGPGTNGGSGPERAGKRPLPHIDDIKPVQVDIDPHTPMDKVLSAAESYIKSAESSKAFGRVDVALRDYIKASIIVIEVIKKNKGWVALQNDNKTQFERYQRLRRQIEVSQDAFDQIKATILADNARTGVKPTVQPSQTLESSHISKPAHGASMEPMLKPTGLANGSARHGVLNTGDVAATQISSPSAKAKPVVHPKPQALHGKAIKPSSGGTTSDNKAAQELAQRFANLRANPAPLGQDPRIRTQPIVPPRPNLRGGVVAPPAVALASALPDLPKVPDAIYSPARGTVSNEAAQLPSSTPRGIFSRTNSIASISNNSGPKSPPLDDRKTPSQTIGGLSTTSSRTKPTIPDGNTLSAQDLFQLLQLGSKELSILVIDIRSREEFDDGHIMSQASICIESNILVREHISADQIADSMVLASASEQLNFERRHDFDLVVFYDQDSADIPLKPVTDLEKAISGLYNAFTHYDFLEESRPKPPKLLSGGLDAWTGLMGQASLQVSSTSIGNAPRPSPMPTGRRPIYRPKQRRSFVAKPIQDLDEAKRWEETMNNPESFSPVRTTDEFLRRFPSVSGLGAQESMAPPISVRPRINTVAPGTEAPRHEEHMPSPQRPPPVVPRHSHSGLAEKKDDRAELEREWKERPKAEKKDGDRKLVGLRNPGNWCYANSSLQSMFGTPGFSHDLLTGGWQDQYRVPKKTDEKIEPPQLMVKMLANLFSWMDKGTFEVMEAKTLMSYLRAIHQKTENGVKRPKEEVFGGESQQDAQEYFNFIIDQLHDETNRFRNKTGEAMAASDNDRRSWLQYSIDFWIEYRKMNESIVDRYWRGLLVTFSSCRNCNHNTTTCQVSDVTALSIKESDPRLESMLREHFSLQSPEDYKCEACNKPGREMRTVLARMPDRLAIVFTRFQQGMGRAAKINTRVEFPMQNLDLTPYWIGPEQRAITNGTEAATIAKDDDHFHGPFLYDCYAVICHIGSTLSGGHYIAYVKDESSATTTDWLKCNDSKVSKVKVGSNDDKDELPKMYKSGDQQAYMVFYKRKRAGDH